MSGELKPALTPEEWISGTFRLNRWTEVAFGAGIAELRLALNYAPSEIRATDDVKMCALVAALNVALPDELSITENDLAYLRSAAEEYPSLQPLAAKLAALLPPE